MDCQVTSLGALCKAGAAPAKARGPAGKPYVPGAGPSSGTKMEPGGLTVMESVRGARLRRRLKSIKLRPSGAMARKGRWLIL
jgi:hypothetical protein